MVFMGLIPLKVEVFIPLCLRVEVNPVQKKKQYIYISWRTQKHFTCDYYLSVGETKPISKIKCNENSCTIRIFRLIIFSFFREKAHFMQYEIMRKLFYHSLRRS